MELQSLLTTLVSFKTVHGNHAAFEDLYAWVVAQVAGLPLTVRRHVVHGYPALTLTTRRTRNARLWLAAHVDVVPADARQFVPRVRAGKLYGRGAFDMKFAVASYLAVLTELGTQVREYDLGIMLTSDEEQGGDSAVHTLLSKERYTGDVAFLPDGTGSWVFEEASKGILKLRVSAHGERAHGSRPWCGRSAVHLLCAYVHDAVQAFDALALSTDEHHWHTTMHVGQIEGGESFNTVAPSAHAVIDIRYPNAQAFTAIQETLTALHARHPYTGVRILQHYGPYGIDRQHEYVEMFAQAAIAEQRTCDWARAHGSSDARFFHAAHIPTILIAPEGGCSHGDGEWVDLKDLAVYTRVLRRFVETVARR